MEKIILGDTGIEVSRLCFGSLTMTPFQANLSLKEGASLIQYAFHKGINFLDTAEIYNNYNYIKAGFKGIQRDKYVLATKTYSYTQEMAEDCLNRALKDLDTDYIDILLLHEQESVHTIKGHYPAIEYFLRAKEQGKIRALGISTHKISGASGMKDYKELDIIHPIINIEGIGILDGTLDQMLSEINDLHILGMGVYSMKPLGGGHLISKTEKAIEFLRNKSYIHSIAIGMQSTDEVDANVQMMENGYIHEKTKIKLKSTVRRLIVQDYCQGCGECVERCKHGGITLVDGQATPNENCILCGYCATVCPEFCIKVI